MKKQFLFSALFLSSLFFNPIQAQIKIIAHRGASAYEAENSLSSFKKAFDLKADAVELDIWRTTDDSLVVIHDRTTGRVADKNLVVPESSSAELRNLKLKNGEKIPYLSEVLPLIPKGKKIVIEIKNYDEKGSVGKSFPQLSDMLKKWGRPQDAIIISFNAEILGEGKTYLPKNKFYFLTGKKDAEDEIIAECMKNNLDGLDIYYGILTPGLSEKAKAEGLDLLIWTVDDPQIAIDAKDKISAVTTNKPDLIRNSLKKAKTGK